MNDLWAEGYRNHKGGRGRRQHKRSLWVAVWVAVPGPVKLFIYSKAVSLSKICLTFSGISGAFRSTLMNKCRFEIKKCAKFVYETLNRITFRTQSLSTSTSKNRCRFDVCQNQKKCKKKQQRKDEQQEKNLQKTQIIIHYKNSIY